MADNRLPEEGDRIAKLLARAGIASRREIERMIADGRVSIDGKVLTTPAVKLNNLNGVTVDGKAVAQAEAPRLFAFHKPSGLITAERDPKGRPTTGTKSPTSAVFLPPLFCPFFLKADLFVLDQDLFECRSV